MKRKITLTVILILFISALALGIVWATSPQLFSGSADDSSDSQQPNVQRVEYPVLEGEVEHTYEIDAQVISGVPEIYTTEIHLDGITESNFSLKKNKGDSIAPEEILYVYAGKDYSAGFNGLVTDIVYEQTDNDKSVTVRLLNYDNLFIEANIEMDKIDKINYDTPVKVVFNGDEARAKIETIGFEIIDETLPVNISLPMKLYPGTPVKLIFTLEVREAGLYVPREAVYSDGEEYYVFVKDGDNLKRTQIKVGQEFSLEENQSDGVSVFEYIEILSGVSSGDTLVVETVDYMGSNIKENLNNE